jgi:hypothetical protein
MSKNKAWIQYTKQGEIVPGSLIVSPRRPVNGVWYEVITDICCDIEPPFGLISSKQKAFVKYDASGNIVPGSLVLTDGRLPRPGIWKEVYIDICCSSTTSTTTTTTTNKPLEIGDKYEGGYIAYLNPDGRTGFTVVPEALGNPFVDGDYIWWEDNPGALFVPSAAIGDGLANTNLIVNTLGPLTIPPPPSTYAAEFCLSYVSEGIYTGWHLPSKDELDIVGANKQLGLLPSVIFPTGGELVWTSTQAGPSDAYVGAWSGATYSSSSFTIGTSSPWWVMPVRYF